MSGCPCTIEGVAPCGPACTCLEPFMSGGCTRCASYGSLEQRQVAARSIAAAVSAAFAYEPMTSIDDLRKVIRSCEGRHVQQVAYSSYMGTLTQLCFTCRRIRSTIGWDGARSWSLERPRGT